MKGKGDGGSAGRYIENVERHARFLAPDWVNMRAILKQSDLDSGAKLGHVLGEVGIAFAKEVYQSILVNIAMILYKSSVSLNIQMNIAGVSN